MLNVQQKLRSGVSLEELCVQHNLSAVPHQELPLVILNYTLDSKKDDAVANECRGLTLEKGSWNVVAKAFSRFFNYGEQQEIIVDNLVCLARDYSFDWSTARCVEKVDGSLILIYWYAGKWRVNTRKSFGQGNIAGTSFTWEELVLKTLSEEEQYFNPEYTYVFELVSPWTQVVKWYEAPALYLLSIVDNIYLQEMSWTNQYTPLKNQDAWYIPKTFEFNSPELAKLYFAERNEKDFEGFVFVDQNFNRVKLKSESYLTLHHLKNNNHTFLLHNLVKIVLSGEGSEVATYFPGEAEKVRKLEDQIAWDKLACYNFLAELDKSLLRKEIAGKIFGNEFAKRFYGVFFKAIDCPDLHFNEVWEQSIGFLEKVYEKEFKLC